MATLGGIAIKNTKDLISPNTRLCAMLYAPPKYGKTTAAATLNALTRKYMNKPTLFVAVEAADGGGTMSIADLGVDYIQPASFDEVERVIAALHTDATYGGVVFDNATEYVKRFLQPYALKFPTKGAPPQTRTAGVPYRDDYQTMGEKAREHFNRLVNLTTLQDLNLRKHLVVIANEREKTDDSNNVVAIQPELPGAMASTATAMFQTVGSLRIVPKREVVDGKPRTKMERRLVVNGDGVRIIGDRTHVFPDECEPDFCLIWEKYWMPRFAEKPAVAA